MFSNKLVCDIICFIDKDINRNTKFGNGEPFDYCKNASIKEISMFIIPALAFDE